MYDNIILLRKAEVKGVLDEYDHSFTIDPNYNYVILYGPNGIGKTKFLEIVYSLSKCDVRALSRQPFSSAMMEYSDNSRLEVTRKEKQQRRHDDHDYSLYSLSFSLIRKNGKLVKWEYEDDGFEDALQRRGIWERINDSLWRDMRDDEIVEIEELRSRYRHQSKKETYSKQPKELADFISKVPSFLIETQRLRVEQSQVRPHRPRYDSEMSYRHPTSRIIEQSIEIKKKIDDAQTEHSKITQQLDRTFPKRVLDKGPANDEIDENQIRDRYDKQNDFRSRLGRIASVDLARELSLPEGEIDPWPKKLLNLYLDDAEKKLIPFKELLLKIDLLEDVINRRLLNKKLSVTGAHGLEVVNSRTSKPIELSSLSSGEQHEIILMIDLLFSVPKGGLVLIDEPEISLHVAWQLAFIPDVRKIADQGGFCFVVATHSPQIINGDWERAKSLGSSEG
ncbi:MAG: AAA family ATPase [Propionibacteriaceae bacterium]|jgi:predicted ATP-binding protein involved in virulence|nr:AAA family ATPase [Propionibacteriaceae bacterium]